jgi:hypothetical protein
MVEGEDSGENAEGVLEGSVVFGAWWEAGDQGEPSRISASLELESLQGEAPGAGEMNWPRHKGRWAHLSRHSRLDERRFAGDRSGSRLNSAT